jgi:hypothetical protein
MTAIDLRPARDWLDRHGERAAVAPHGDADGLSAGVLLARRARGAVLHLRERYAPPAGAGDYGRGHARATGGALVPEAFERFAAAIL